MADKPKKFYCRICTVRQVSSNGAMCSDCKSKTDKLIGDLKDPKEKG